MIILHEDSSTHAVTEKRSGSFNLRDFQAFTAQNADAKQQEADIESHFMEERRQRQATTKEMKTK